MADGNGIIDDHGDLAEITWDQYLYFLWHGVPRGMEIVKVPEQPKEK
ncbi:hypothetical protein ACQCVK_04110 [Rossellomorea vietnamensis]